MITFLAALLLGLALSAHAQEPSSALGREPDLIVAGGEPQQAMPEPSCFDGDIRISALITSSGKVKVGIVDAKSGASYLVGAGESAGSVRVVEADYEKEQVVLQRGTEVCTLSLAADPNAPLIQAPAAIAAMQNSPLYRGEAIENFLKEFPEAMTNGMIKFPLPVAPPAKGKGETIEKFLAANPELAEKVNKPVVGKGEGIESFLKQHPEIKVQDKPIPEGSLGPGIEEMLKKNPTIVTNTIPGAPPATPE
jgi:hypothetical protein